MKPEKEASKMGKGKKWHMGNAVLRMVFVGLSLLFQTAWILFLILRLNEYSIRISFMTGILTVIVVLQLYSRHTTPALKLPWIMLIMALPVMGISLYLMFEVFGEPFKPLIVNAGFVAFT